jgi:hypothetical protein
MADHNDTLVQVEVTLARAKRVARESRLVVQSLAQLRDDLSDTLQSEEDTRNEQHADRPADA